MRQGKDRLSDPDYAAFAWGRFRRLMALVAAVATLTILAVLGYLYLTGVPMPWPMVLATIGGVGLTVLLGGALMGLVFLSHGTGHDDDVINPMEDE